MTRFPRSVSVLLATGLIVGGLAGCSTGGGSPGSDSTGGSISFMTWTEGANVDAATNALATQYMSTHPGTTIKVTILPYAQYEQKIQLAVAGGATPDIFQASPGSAVRFINSGKVLDIGQYVSKDPILSDPSKVRQAAFSLAKIDGEHLDSFPLFGLCGMQLYYNKTLFDRAGVAYPTASWTWDDFRAAAKKLTIKKNGQTVQWGTEIGYLQGWDGGWQTMAASDGMNTLLETNAGKPKLDLEQTPVVDTWQFMEDLVFKDGSAPTPAASNAMSQAGGAFMAGKAAMSPNGCWQAGPMKQAVPNLGIVTLPRGTTGKSIGPVWGNNMFIAKSSKHPKLAYDFLRWMTVDKSAVTQFLKASLCFAPVVKAYDPIATQELSQISGGQACIDSLTGASNFTIWTENWEQSSTNVLDPLWYDQFLRGKITGEQLAQQLNEKLNPVL